MNLVSFEQALRKVQEWAKNEQYAGYSKFDLFHSPVINALFSHTRLSRLWATAIWSRLPLNPRVLFHTKKALNPKGIALFALSYLKLYQCYHKREDLDEAQRLLQWLAENATSGYSGACWGYDHDWQSVYFYAPRGMPNIIVTGNVAYAFLEAFEITGEDRYLALARSAADFMLFDLPVLFTSSKARAIGYVPGSRACVLNVNGIAANVLIWLWQHTGEPLLRKEAERLMSFLLSAQTPYGGWHYAHPSRASRVKHDNYHTGNVLDWTLEYGVRAADKRCLQSYTRGIKFYQKFLFLPDGAPKWRSDKTYPLDIHGAAQGIVTFSKAALTLSPKFLNQAQKIARWTLRVMQAKQGYFYYQKGRWFTRKYTLMRWCNAWMAYALSLLIFAEEKTESPEKSRLLS